MDNLFTTLREKNPLVHCISNYVTVNDLANTILALGGSPIMADDSLEVEEITSIADSLLINIGTLNKNTVESMLLASKKANEKDIPIVFDPVGIGVSNFRQETSFKILENAELAVIKGNASEIKYIYTRERSMSGVDVDKNDEIQEDNLSNYTKICHKLSEKYNTIIVLTGPIDIVSGEGKTYLIKNSSPFMEKITGTGCILGGVLASFVGANKDRMLESVVLGLGLFALMGEKSEDYIRKNNLGNLSFRKELVDNIFKLDFEEVKEDLRIELYS